MRHPRARSAADPAGAGFRRSGPGWPAAWQPGSHAARRAPTTVSIEMATTAGDIPRLTSIVRTTRSTASFTKPQAPSAALTGIPPNGPGPARYPSGLVFPADRGSLRRRQCADQLRHPRQLRLAGGTARCFQHSTQDPPNQRQDASGAPNQPLAEIFTASSGTIAGLATSPSVVAMKRLLVRQFYVTSSLGCGPNLSGRASAVSTSSLSADQDTALTRT